MRIIPALFLSLALAACASVDPSLQQGEARPSLTQQFTNYISPTPAPQQPAKPDLSSPQVTGVTASPVLAEGLNIPKGGGRSHIGKPYKISGKMYYPSEKVKGEHQETGQASWYGTQFHGRKTANGEIFNMHSMSAAHRTMPLPSYARVTNLGNGKSVIVRVNDRGPFAHNRIIDVSSRAADLLDFKRTGVARVKVEYQGRADVQGSDDRRLEASLTHGAPAEMPAARAPVMTASNKPVMLSANTLAKAKQSVSSPSKPIQQAILANSPQPKSDFRQKLDGKPALPQLALYDSKPNEEEKVEEKPSTASSILARLKPKPLDE